MANIMTSVRHEGILPFTLKQQLKALGATIEETKIPPVPRKIRKNEMLYVHYSQEYGPFTTDVLLTRIQQGVTLITDDERRLLIRVIGKTVYLYKGENSEYGMLGRILKKDFLNAMNPDEVTYVYRGVHSIFSMGIALGRYFLEKPIAIAFAQLPLVLKWDGSDLPKKA